MASPVVAWEELEGPFAQRNELPGISRFQAHYACYHNKSYASSESEFLQARFNSHLGDTWLTVRLRIYVAPAETVLPIKKDRQFSPEFQVQVEVQSTRAITFEGTVYAFALNEQQKNELTVGLGEGSRLPRSVSDSLLAAATGQPNPSNHPFKGTCSVPVSIAFEPEVISCLPKEHIAKKVADVTFSKLEFKNPSNMEPRYFLFAIAVGTSPAAADVSAVLFTPPTISICRGVQQRNKATKKLRYMNPDEMYAAVASRGGEAYKTKAGANAKRSSVTGATGAEQDGDKRGGGSSMTDEQNGSNIAEARRCQPSPDTKRENLEKFWDTGGGNREVQNPSMAAATASIFGSHVGLSQGGAVGAKQEPGRSAATDIAKLFPRATSLASSGFEAVPMRKPKAMDMTSALLSHPLPLPSTTNTIREKAGAASTGTPFDGAFGAPDLQLSLPFDVSALRPDRGQPAAREDGDVLFGSMFMAPADESKPPRSQPPPAPEGAAAKGFSAFHTLVNSGSTDPQQQKLAQAPPLFTGLPGGPGSSSHAALQAGRGTAGGGGAAGDRGAGRLLPDSLQGIAQQVAAVGLSGRDGSAGGMWGTGTSAQMAHGAARPKQQPVESPFGGPPGAGMPGWAAGLSSGSLTLGESFDPLMALELLDSRAAAEGNPGILESQAMTMDMFSSFAPSLDMAAATAGHQAPAASAGLSRPPQGLERSRPTAHDAQGAGASWQQQQQRQARPSAADTASAYFGSAAHGGAAACPRDRERSLQTEGFQARNLQSTHASAQPGAGSRGAGVPPPLGMSFPTAEDADAHVAHLSNSFSHLEMSFDFGNTEALPPGAHSHHTPGTSTSRDDGTAEGTTGAPSVNFAIDEMEGDMVAPHEQDRTIEFGASPHVNVSPLGTSPLANRS